MDLREILCDLTNRCVTEINDCDDIKQPIKDKILIRMKLYKICRRNNNLFNMIKIFSK